MTITLEPFAKMSAACDGCGRSASAAHIAGRHFSMILCASCLGELHRLTAPVAPVLTVGAWFAQIVEVQYEGGWYQLRADGYERWWRQSSVDLAWKWSMWMQPGGAIVRDVLALPCRLVAIADADGSPDERGPL